MSKRSRTGMRGCLIILIAVICLAAVALAWAASDLPRWAGREFGPANARHTWFSRLALSAQLFYYRYDLSQPLDAFGGERDFQVEMGESPISVAHRLQTEGFIRNAGAFRIYLVYSGLDTTLQAGAFQLSPAWNAVEIARKMQDATPGQVSFRILAGWRLEEIAAALPVNGVDIDPQVFIRAARNPVDLSLPVEWQPGTSLEGYLYPDVYTFKRTASVPELLYAFISRFFEQVPPDIFAGFERQGLTRDEGVILASIVEREAVVVDEMPMIASVFLNRLAINQKLDSDPTVQYALGYQAGTGGWWKNPLSLNDLQIDSSYNTYMYRGLPPGPISNPSLEALQAVAMPAQTPYYYFRAACDNSGRHNFARTFEEQLSNACP